MSEGNTLANTYAGRFVPAGLHFWPCYPSSNARLISQSQRLISFRVGKEGPRPASSEVVFTLARRIVKWKGRVLKFKTATFARRRVAKTELGAIGVPFFNIERSEPSVTFANFETGVRGFVWKIYAMYLSLGCVLLTFAINIEQAHFNLSLSRFRRDL